MKYFVSRLRQNLLQWKLRLLQIPPLPSYVYFEFTCLNYYHFLLAFLFFNLGCTDNSIKNSGKIFSYEPRATSVKGIL